MDILGRKRRFIFQLAILILLFPALTVHAEENDFNLLIGPLGGQDDNYIELIAEDSQEYEVAAGDSLWNIAGELWGDGNLYESLFDSNRDKITDPDLIYPGMMLNVNSNVYVRRLGRAGESVTTPPYHIQMVTGNTVGMKSGDYGANFCLFGDSVDIACLIQDKDKAAARTLADWNRCKKEIERYAEENYGDLISGLTFEHYRSLKGEEIYLYSYRYKMDFGEYGDDLAIYVNVSVGTKLTEHFQAEFIGFAYQEETDDAVRYVTAGFEESSSSEGASITDMAIWPSESWEMEGIFNSFAWISGSYDAVAERIIDEIEGKKDNFTSKYPKF